MSWLLYRKTEDSLIRFSLNLREIIHKFHTEEDLCTIVSIPLNSNSDTFSVVFVNILIQVEANNVQN